MRVVVVGGGLAGLVAAWTLAEDHEDEVLVLEASPQVGGKLRLAEVGGVPVDVGAEAMLARRPEGVDLARELGLEVVTPTAASSRVWTRGALRPLPRSLMGVPLDLSQLARSGVLSETGLARVRRESEEGMAALPPEALVGRDLPVAELVAARLGQEVVDRLVEPLLGGVYAGQAARLSARATVPQLVAMAERGPFTTQGAEVLAATHEGPVFAGVAGGVARLAIALAACGRFRVRTGAAVRELRRRGGDARAEGFRLTVGSAAAPELVECDDVVLATPPAASARLLADVVPAAAAELVAIGSASVAVVTLAYRAADLPEVVSTSSTTVDGSTTASWGSGFLVPPVDGRRIKAATFSFAKWGWVRDAGRGGGVLLLRTSVGRYGEEASLQVSDHDLVLASRADLADAIGLAAAPLDAHVQRWGGGLPQYAVGHIDRVARIRAGVADQFARRSPRERGGGLAVCGAAYDGVGIPAVIASARRAAAEIRAGSGHPAQ